MRDVKPPASSLCRVRGFDPLTATGLLVNVHAEGQRTCVGSATMFRFDHVALTAAHCVLPDLHQLEIHQPRLEIVRKVTEVKRHPTADIAVLFAEPHETDTVGGTSERAFWDRVSNWGIGEEFVAYGYALDDGPAMHPSRAIPRVFRGHFQRVFDYGEQGIDHWKYLAAELSIPAPVGLSGGPLFREGAPPMLTGIVTANVDSYVTLDSFTEVTEDSRIHTERNVRVISYGIALMLSGLDDWLRNTIPDEQGRGWVS